MISVIRRHPSHFVILDCPTDQTLPAYIPTLKTNNVTDLVRICDSDDTYDIAPLRDVGIRVHDHIKFEDGGVPSEEIVESWLELTEKVFDRSNDMDQAGNDAPRTIGVHCVSGIGRAPVDFNLGLFTSFYGCLSLTIDFFFFFLNAIFNLSNTFRSLLQSL